MLLFCHSENHKSKPVTLYARNKYFQRTHIHIPKMKKKKKSQTQRVHTLPYIHTLSPNLLHSLGDFQKFFRRVITAKLAFVNLFLCDFFFLLLRVWVFCSLFAGFNIFPFLSLRRILFFFQFIA